MKLGLSKNVVYKMFVLHELVRLRVSFGRDPSVDEQIEEMLDLFDVSNNGDMSSFFSDDSFSSEEMRLFIEAIYDYFKKQL